MLSVLSDEVFDSIFKLTGYLAWPVKSRVNGIQTSWDSFFGIVERQGDHFTAAQFALPGLHRPLRSSTAACYIPAT